MSIRATCGTNHNTYRVNVMAVENHTTLNRLLSSHQSACAISEHLSSLTIDAMLIELSNAGIKSVNPTLLKSLIIVTIMPEVTHVLVERSAKSNQKPISGENFRSQSIKIHKTYLAAHKTGDRNKILNVAQVCLTNIERLEAWPRIDGEEYNDVWLSQTKTRIANFIQMVKSDSPLKIIKTA